MAPAYGLAEHTLIVTGKGDWKSSASVLYVDAVKLRAERIVEVFTPEEAAAKPPGEVQDVVSCGFPFQGVTGEYMVGYYEFEASRCTDIKAKGVRLFQFLCS